MSDNKIKIMIVDDSVLIRKYVSQIVENIDNFELIATAPNGKIGLQKVFIYRPDVIILDIEMPELDGISFLKYLQENTAPSQRPHVIVFSSLVGEGSHTTFEALEHGAADFIKKPEGKISDNMEFLQKEMEIKIKELYHSRSTQAPPRTETRFGLDENDQKSVVEHEVRYGLHDLEELLTIKKIHPKLIAVGSSTGGPNAIRRLLNSLGELPVPMVIAQHMPSGFTLEFAKNLTQMFHREVVEAQDKQELKDGVIYICPGGYHGRIKKEGDTLLLETDPRDYEGFFFKPSADIFFKSITESVGKDVIGVILSGMGRDGSTESVKLRNKGAIIIAQDKNSSVVWGMPGNAVRNGGIDIIININDMGTAINTIIDRFSYKITP